MDLQTEKIISEMKLSLGRINTKIDESISILDELIEKVKNVMSADIDDMYERAKGHYHNDVVDGTLRCDACDANAQIDELGEPKCPYCESMGIPKCG